MGHWFECRDGSPLPIIDLEATCWGSRHTPDGVSQSIHSMEIIEIGCAFANRQGELLDTQSFLVRPTRNPLLSTFCTGLTGITQPMVDSAPELPEAIEAYRFLFEEKGLLEAGPLLSGIKRSLDLVA